MSTHLNNKPTAYEPADGYKYQIFCRNSFYSRSWEHCDYAETKEERNRLLNEYRLAYGGGWEFGYIVQPKKFWPVPAVPMSSAA